MILREDRVHSGRAAVVLSDRGEASHDLERRSSAARTGQIFNFNRFLIIFKNTLWQILLAPGDPFGRA
jgi:hypothetical protein